MEKIRLYDVTRVDDRHDDAGTVRFAPDQVAPGRQVTLHFELALGDGSVIDSNFTGAPVTFRVGDGNLLPGFEAAISGLRPGDETTVLVTAAQAFGPHRDENIQRIPRYRFPADLAMASGLVVNFVDSAGNDQAGVVCAATAGMVTVDFNHPLAGKDIHFRVRVLTVSTPLSTPNGHDESP